MAIAGLKELRDAKASGRLAADSRKAISDVLGPRAAKSLDTPTGAAAVERHGECLLALAEAVAAFSMDAQTAEAMAAAAQAYAASYRDLMLIIGNATRVALGIRLQ